MPLTNSDSPETTATWTGRSVSLQGVYQPFGPIFLTKGSCQDLRRARLAAVRFGPVQCGFLLNLKPDHRSGSYKSLNVEPDRRVCAERVQRVRFRVQQFLDPEPDFLLQ